MYHLHFEQTNILKRFGAYSPESDRLECISMGDFMNLVIV